MGKLLFEDNIFNRTMTKLFDLLVIGILTVICCLLIVTGGAAITSAYRVLMKMQKDHEGTITGSYFREFKSNLKESFGGWFLIILVVTLLAFDLSVWASSESGIRGIAYGVTVVTFASVLAVIEWYFSIRATFEETTISSIKKALSFAVVYMWQTVVLAIYDLVMLYIITRSGYFIFHIVVFGFGIITFPKTFLINNAIDRFIEEKTIE
ncbi:MAG: YesL family protein [Eubacterium sp.]|nr:YesL family protein [Eubacterium sp.]